MKAFYFTLGLSFASADFENLTKIFMWTSHAKITCKIWEFWSHNLQLTELHYILVALLC